MAPLALEPTLRTPPELRERYLREGLWSDQSVGEWVAEHIAAAPEAELRVWSATRPGRTTVGAAYQRARSLAAGLRARGFGPGDAIAYQMPNWLETPEIFWGLSALGAIVVPIVHYYGPRELAYILERTRVRALVMADRFAAFDYLANLAAMRPKLPDLELVAVVSAAPGAPLPADVIRYESLLDAAPLPGPLAVDPDQPAIVGYTSGTTADPKGVIHASRSVLAELGQQLSNMPPDDRPQLMGAPAAHAIGLFGGVLNPLGRGQPIHLTDQWNAERVLAAMLEADLSSGSGATIFLTSLLDSPRFGAAHLAKMRFCGMGGSPVPAAVCERAEALGIGVMRAYGSTEHPSITSGHFAAPRIKRNTTDGRPGRGVEIRLLDDEGREVAVGEPGEILSRGPDLFAGYTDPALTARAVDAEGWYATGDVGVLDADGYLTITDRKSDFIIRGGANISAAEIEELAMRMPGVAEIAVVAAPDARLGEHACAWLRLAPGSAAPDLAALQRHLGDAGLPKPKWPEELRLIDEFPRTPSGKIKKFELRRRLREDVRR
jgi:acyl-CoA synthetase (AMP-forming)/AMP-acid ligase II